MKSLLTALLLALLSAGCEASNLAQHAEKLSSLIDPAKLATLKARGANARVQKAVALLESARQSGSKVETAVAGASA